MCNDYPMVLVLLLLFSSETIYSEFCFVSLFRKIKFLNWKTQNKQSVVFICQITDSILMSLSMCLKATIKLL